jgi:hypothetical protein
VSYVKVALWCLMRKSRYANNLLRLMPVLPAPIARAGPAGLHSRPDLHNASGVTSLSLHSLLTASASDSMV